MQVQINPLSAAQHYATSAQFWENHAKTLQHRLDEAQARVEELERLVAHTETTNDSGSQDD